MGSCDQYTYICHTACRYFPCHQGADPHDFNCLFCYCPLYALGEDCGGNFHYTEDGVKDCSTCLLPHGKAGYEHILDGCNKIVALLQRKKQGRKRGHR